MSTPPLVTIFGGSGFVGRYIAQAMAREGWRVRVAVRRPNDALFVQPYGVVGQVVPVQANIRDEASTRAAIAGADAVVNCVGILSELGQQTFDAVQADGAARVARIAAEEGVGRFVQISAIGADAGSDSAYARSKAAGEAAVLAARPDAVILRPSIIFGHEDAFFNRFAGMARLSPVLPIVGGATEFQPVYVGDVAAAARAGVLGQAAPGIYELGGPEVARFRDLIKGMLEIIRRKRLVLELPVFAARIIAGVLGLVQLVSGGLIPNRSLTRDQIVQLGQNNVARAEFPGLQDLGIAPTAMDAVLESYLYPYRPQGEYTRITESARDLRG